MKSRIAKLMKTAAFLLIGVIIFSIVQQVFIPSASRKRENADRTIDGLRQIEPDTVDVIFLGTSLVECGVSPMRLYEKTGICGYSLATSAQPIGASYWLLKDAFRRQSPSVVFLLATSLYDDIQIEANTVRWWHVLDNFRLSPFKFEMARDYDTVAYSNGWLPALFPIIKYHTRWDALSEQDFQLSYGGEYYSLGEWVDSMVTENKYATVEDINRVANLLQQEFYVTEHSGNETKTKTVKHAPDPSLITDYTRNVFLKIKELCDENGAELVLFQIPLLLYPNQGTTTWTKAQSDEMHEFARTYDVALYDLQYDTDIGLDWNTDCRDNGIHLNLKGAEKVSDALGSYLQEQFSIRQQSNPQYDAYAALYNKVRKVIMLQSETSLPAYLDLLEQNKDQWSVFIVAGDGYTAGIKADVIDKFENLGLSLIGEGEFEDAYTAVIDQGEVKYEAVSNDRIDYETGLNNGLPVRLSSAGRNISDVCAINLNGRQYAPGDSGLNFVVFDNESNLVIDSVEFDTGDADNTFYRDYSGVVNTLLHVYESNICF